MIKQIRRNFLTTTLLNGFTYLIPLVVTPYFVRVAGTENFGLLNIAQSIIQYLILFVGFNLDVSVSGDVAVEKSNKEKLREIFWQTMYARLVLLVLAIIMFIGIFLFFWLNNKDTFLLTLTFFGLIGYAITPLWFYQGTEDFLRLFLFVAIGKILFAVIVFTCVTKPQSYWYYSFGLSLSQIVSGVLLLLFPIIKYRIKPLKFRLKETTCFLKQKFALFKGGTMVNFCININVTLLGIVLSLQDFGLYMAANKLILVVFTLVTLPLNQSLYPYISRSITEDFGLAVSKIKNIMIPSLFYFAIVICFGLFLFSKPIIYIMLGSQFLKAETPFRLMLFSLIANVLTNVIILQLFIKLSFFKAYAKITLLAAMLSIVATLILSLWLGVTGAAIAWLAGEFFLLFYSVNQLKRKGANIFIYKSLHPRTFLNYWTKNKIILLRK